MFFYRIIPFTATALTDSLGVKIAMTLTYL